MSQRQSGWQNEEYEGLIGRKYMQITYTCFHPASVSHIFIRLFVIRFSEDKHSANSRINLLTLVVSNGQQFYI